MKIRNIGKLVIIDQREDKVHKIKIKEKIGIIK